MSPSLSGVCSNGLRLLLPALLFSLCSSPEARSQPVWREVLPPFGAISDIFAGSETTGTIITANVDLRRNAVDIYRSTDNGVTWSLGDSLARPQQPVSILDCENGIFWACTTTGVLRRSVDDGRTWQQVAILPGFHSSYLEMYLDDRRIIIGTRRSSDGGATWDSLASGVGGALRTFTMGEILLLQNGWLHASTDQGASWRKLPSRPLAQRAIDYATAIGDTILAFSSYSERLYVSGDTGRTWQQRGAESWSEATRYITNGDELFVIESRRVLRTTDRGLSWQAVIDTPRYGSGFFVRDSLWLAGSAGIIRSVDRGESWRQTGLHRAPVNNPIPTDGKEMLLFHNDTMWVMSEDHLFSRGPGDSLYILRAGLGDLRWGGKFRISDGGIWEIGSGNILHRTTDHGRTWSAERAPLESRFPLRFGNWIFTQESPARSSDGGTSWQTLDEAIEPFIDGKVSSLFAVDTTLFVIVEPFHSLSTTSLLFRSNDWGETWAECAGVIVGSNYKYPVRSGDTLLIGHGGMIYRSGDHGVTWDSVRFAGGPDEYFQNFTYSKGRYVVVTHEYTLPDGKENRIRISDDDGATWRVVMDGLPEDFAARYGVDPGNPMGFAWNGDQLYLFGGAIYTLDASTLSAGSSSDERAESLSLIAHPTPSSERISLTFRIPRSGHVRLEVVDPLGRPLALLVDETMAEGRHTITYDPRGHAAGLLLIHLRADGRSATARATFVR